MSGSLDAQRHERAARRRATMTIRLTRVGDAESLGPFGLEAMELACSLSLAAYSVAGIRVLPTRRESMAVALRPPMA